MKKKVLMTMLSFCLAVVFLCVGTQAKSIAADFKNPVITLESFMVPQYDGYWYYSKKVEATKGDPGDRGAPLPMSFLFNIENPNSFPVLLEEIQFTAGFEGFDLVTVNSTDSCWIPGKKTDQVRVNTMITVRSGLLSLLVTGGYKLKEKGWSPWDALERWWKGVPEYSIPVTVHEGAFTFNAKGAIKILPFQAVTD
ncbi:MAG: hypothetical protein GY864_01355 [Desulfobacterales bacterium]|nr:hypothetical protein [Desulfobacterales bacterium]